MPDTPIRLAETAFALESHEAAAYRMLRGLAERAGDERTALVADRILEQVEEAAALVADSFDRRSTSRSPRAARPAADRRPHRRGPLRVETSVRRRLASLIVLVAALAVPTSPAQAAAEVLVRFAPTTSATERIDARRGADVRRARGFAVPGLEAVAPAPGVSTAAAAAALRREPGVLYAEPDVTRRAWRLPGDPFFPFQWALTRIDAPAAWDTTTGSAQVLVAVADSGADLDHPDLAGNLVAGWDFADDDPNPQDEDPNGHGTHVAGIIGAAGDDGTGVAGVAWTTRVMPVRVLGADGRVRVSDAIRASEWAARAGARIVNLSFGGPTASSAERDALAAAPDVLFVAAAGNDGDDQPDYPCAYDLPNVVCVTASDAADGRPAFANVGAHSVDLAAPGTVIFGPIPDDRWGTLSGTSMAAPHVAGTAALLLAREPAARPEDLIAALVGTAAPAPAFAGLTVSGGRLDASAALHAVRATPSPAPSPTPTAAPPVVSAPPPPAAPAAVPPPAKLKVRRAGVRDGRLDVLARITRAAHGRVEVAYRARGRTVRFTAPIEHGRIRFAHRLPRAQRRGSGIVTLHWPGSDAARPATVRLRAATQRARLRRESASLRDGRLVVSGRISSRARGVVRLRLGYVDGGAVAYRSYAAAIDRGRWRLAVPATARDGYLSIQFTGYRGARGGPMRGEQDGIAVGRP
jgi:subtilisin family serine protease